jgi:hypothetical protein
MILNTYQDTDTSGAGIAYTEPMLQTPAVGIKAVSKDKEEKGPDDLVKRLQAQIMAKESGGRRYDKEGNLLTSSKGALGEMQVMPYTSKDPGFGIKPARSNDPNELRRVGDEYAAAMYNRYKDPKLAMIAYNMGPGATDKWLAAGADPRKLPKETQGYIRGVSLAGGGPVKHFVLGDLVMDDYGSSRGSDPRTQATFDEYNRTAAELEEENKKEKNKAKPLSKEAQRALAEKAAREAKVKGVGPVKPSTPAGIGGLRGATIPSLGLGAVTSLYGGLTGPDQVNIPTAADANAEGLTADEIANAKRPALIYPRIRGKERYTSELPATRDQKPRPIVANPAAVAAAAANKVNVPLGYTPDEAGSPYIDGMPPMVSGAAPAEAAAAAPMSATDKLFAQMQDAYAKREARLEAARKQDPYLAMLAAGLGMMGGTSPYAFTNIGQGGAQGVAQYATTQKLRAAEEAGLGNLQNKMYNSAMLGELRRDQMEQAKAGKEAKMSQDLQIAKNAFIEKRLKAAGMDEIMLGNLKRKQAMGKIGADELKLLDYYENQRKNIELEANRMYASPGAGMKIVGVRG